MGESRLSRRPGRVFVRRQCGARMQRPNAGPNAGPERQARTPGPNACPNALSWESPPTSTQNWLFGPVRIQCNSLVRARTLGRGILLLSALPLFGPSAAPSAAPSATPLFRPLFGPERRSAHDGPQDKNVVWRTNETRPNKFSPKPSSSSRKPSSFSGN